MNLQPRRISPAGAEWEPLTRNLPEGIGEQSLRLWQNGCMKPSIWLMELPNTSYLAPQAAFWWVSNEGRAVRGLASSGRA